MAGTRSLGVTIAVAIGTSCPITVSSISTDSANQDGAIFNSKMSRQLHRRVAAAALENGLPESSLGRLLSDLTTQSMNDIAEIPGISPMITQSAVRALKLAYLESFHAVWYAACAFACIGLIRKSINQV
jgi:hypothetical protein